MKTEYYVHAIKANGNVDTLLDTQSKEAVTQAFAAAIVLELSGQSKYEQIDVVESDNQGTYFDVIASVKFDLKEQQ